jgi:hypothetical protein
MELNRRLAIENFSNHSIIVNVINFQHFHKIKCLTSQTKLFTKQEPNEVPKLFGGVASVHSGISSSHSLRRRSLLEPNGTGFN